MFKPESARERWITRTERPVTIWSNAPTVWHGFELQENSVPEEGNYRNESASFRIVQMLSTVKIRQFGNKKSFIELPCIPLNFAPETSYCGYWEGKHHIRNLFIDPAMIERLLEKTVSESEYYNMSIYCPSFKHFLHALSLDAKSGHPSGPMLGESIVVGMLNQLLPKKERVVEQASGNRSTNNQFRLFVDFIEENLSSSFGLEDIAAATDVSVRHIYRTFHSMARMPPHKYILIRRVERAKSLIQAGRLSLTEIALSVGFANHAHMTSTFRKIVGQPPSHFSNTGHYRAGQTEDLAGF